MSRFRFVDDHRDTYEVKRLCTLVEVSTSGFYAWRQRPLSPRAIADEELLETIRAIHNESRHTYGAPRIHGQLRRRGVNVGCKRVARLMRRNGLMGVHRRRWRNRRPDTAPAPDRLNRNFTAERPNQRWVADITEFPTGGRQAPPRRGLLDPDGPGSWTRPDLSRMVYADGKVVTPLFKGKADTRIVNRRTGEIRRPRYETDASLHFEGTGETAWGLKFVLVAVRTTDVHGRIILDTDWVPSPGGEAATSMDSITRIAADTPGLQGVIYDGALRGVCTG